MAKNIEIGLNVSGIISDYRAAISAMEQAGAKANITSGLTKSLDRLEEKFKNLENEGAFGKESSREIENYRKRVDATFSSLGAIGKELERIKGDKKAFPSSAVKEFEKNLEEAKQKVTQLREAFAANFQKLGFSADVSKQLAEAVRGEQDVKKALEDELKLRQQIEVSLKNTASDASRRAGLKATAGQNMLTASNINSEWQRANGFTGKDIQDFTQHLNRMFKDAIRDGQDFAQVWNNGIRNSVFDTEEELSHFVSDMDELKSKIQNVIEKRDTLLKNNGDVQKYETAVRSRAAIGDTSGGTVNFSADSQALIDSTTASLDAMHAASSRVTQQETQRAQAERAATLAEQNLNTATANLTGATEGARSAFNHSTEAIYSTERAAEDASASFDRMQMRILSLISATSIFNLIKKNVKETYEDVKELDKSFASIAMVTKYGVNEMWSSHSQYADMASQLGQKTNDIIQASALFYQQGLDTNEALALTTDTMKLATLAGNDFSTATQEMTSAIRGFKMEMDEGGRVADVYSDLAAHAAATVDDIAQAMSRTASIANSAGMSFENTSAFLTQMIETTQESAENIGTSLKTIIARFTELKENIAGTTDSEFDDLEYNKVDKALKSVGVSLKDVNGQFRNLDEVFLELSEKWDTLDRNTQRYVATIAAGSRQQSRFIAMMDNYDRTVELIGYAADAEGKADEQFAKYADTMEYKLNQLSTKWEEFRVQTLDSDFFKGAIDSLSAFLDRLKNVDLKKTLAIAPFAIWAAKTFIQNFLKGIKSSMGAIKQIGAQISEALTQKNNGVKINIQVERARLNSELTDIKNKLNELGATPKIIKLVADNQQVSQMVMAHRKEVQAATGEVLNYEEASVRLAHTMGLQAQNGSQARDAIKGQANAIRDLNTQEQNAQQELNNLDKMEQKIALTQQAFGAATSVAVMAMSGFVSGAMSGTEALSSFGKMLALSAIQMLANATMAAIASGMKAAAAETEAAAWWSCFAAEVAATMGAALLVVAVMGAVAAVALLLAWIIKQGEESKKAASATEQLAAANKELEKAKSKKNEAKSELKTLEDEKQSITELKDEYNELAKKRIKTQDEQDKMAELAEKIKSEYPEMIRYENEQNGLLSLYNDLEDRKLKKLDEEISKKKQLLEMATLEELRAQTAVDDYSGLTKIETAMGIKVNAQTQMTDFKEMARGDLEKSIDNEIWTTDANGYVVLNEWGEQLSDFANKLAEDGDDYVTKSKESRQEIIDAWNYVMSGEGEVADKFKDAADEMRQSVEAATESFNHFAEYLDVTGVYSKELYADKSDTEQTIRAIFKADEQNGMNVDWTDLKKSHAVGNYSDAKEHYGWMAEQFGLQDNDEAKKIVAAAADMYDEVAEGSWGRENDFTDAYDAMSSDAQRLAEKWGITDQSSYEDFFGDKGAKDEETFRNIERALYNELNEAYLKQKTGYENASTELINQVTTMQMDFQDRTIEEGLGMWNTLNEQLKESGLDADAQKEVRGLANETTEAELQQLQTDIQNIYGKTAEGIKISTAEMLKEAYDGVVNSGVVEASAKQLVDKQLDVLKENGIKEEDWAAYMQIDWSKYTDPASFKTFRDSYIATMKENGITGAEAMFDEMAKYAEQYGALDISIDTELELDKFVEQLDDLKDKVEDVGDTIVDAVKDITEDGAVSFKTFQDAIKNLSELGLNAYDYFDIDANGKITADQEKLKQLYEDQLKAGEKQLIQERNKAILKKNELDIQIKQIEAQIVSLENGGDMVTVEADINNQLQPVLETWVKIAKIMAQITGKDMAEFNQYQTKYITKITNDQRQETIDALKAQLEPMKQSSEVLGDTIESMNKEIENRDKYNAAALRNFNLGLLEAEGKLGDVKKATEEKTKADEEYAKALKDVADKQEALNEKLKEYNDLLYGSDNRKSSLDFLYNYDEAIKSFNDEISRSKELMEDATSTDESTAALQRYTAATHNLLAEERAKQKVIQSGLENYAKMIEEGSYAYTNATTGEKTTINFGDYAKKDSRTGKYIIDQRLINESRFTDEIKDLLEQQVSTYNKYSEELLKSEDNVRKAEKELQEERKAALKNFTAMQKELADALKQHYQDEVDALKDKYDSMKDADDDYISALEDAIEKQRKLRDQESKYEDLAKKEKKLSLMQRDTSGANELETRKLEEEIQKDREDLLDEAIDQVIDGLSELYESQQELRDSEIELKEALLENTLYWNTQAEGLANSFENADEYAQFLSSLSSEYAELTLAMQEEKLQQYGETYEGATEYMAMMAMDAASETGDFVVDTTTVTGDEVAQIVTETAETFSTEVTRAYDETTQKFEEDMAKGIKAINDADAALQEAIKKLNECGAAANAAAEALRAAQQAEASGGTGLDTSTPDVPASTDTSYHANLIDWTRVKDAMNGMGYSINNNGSGIESGQISFGANSSTTHAELANYVQKLYRGGTQDELSRVASSMGLSTTKDNGSTKLNIAELYKNIKERMITADTSLQSVFKYREGGLVDYTGPAWVDGSFDKPEAFLSPEDTERIGNAAKILADIPWMDRDTDNTSVVTNNGGDVNVEINLNIDHISSETDIDEMIERVKEEIVEVARPEGTNVILQQQLS